MPKLAETYHTKANECRALAAAAWRPSDKESWLTLAEQWKAMADHYERRHRFGLV